MEKTAKIKDVHKLIIIIIMFTWGLQQAPGQEAKPKVALVLSGGGAKGIAHIPVLQALDSLEIVPDMIVGTSMGSIVGGLYAMGYSGDSIASMARNAKWGELLGGNLPLYKVSVEEKDEYGKYLVNLDFEHGKLKATPYLLNDQNLRDALTIFTFPAYDIHDFDNLPIPFRAVTADIIKAEQKVLSKGSLGSAMRASMSIPGIFEPVSFGGTLLVDGGILNNFPSDIAKDWGADIIIGSDVSGAGKPMEELEDFGSVVMRAMMLVNYQKYPTNRKLCDIIVDHVPNLTYNAADFPKAQEIFEEGRTAVIANHDALLQLSRILKAYPKREVSIPIYEDKIVLDTVAFSNISKGHMPMIKHRTDIRPFTPYTTNEMAMAVKRAMGTQLLEKIEYGALLDNGRDGLLLTGYERSPNQIRGSLHYDLYRGVGVIANYTGRNIIGRASRFLATLDVAEQPKFLVQYQKNFGKRRNLWWRSEVMGSQLEQKVFIDGNGTDNLREESFRIENQINKNIDPQRSYVGVGLNYRYTDIKPKVAPLFNDNVLFLEKYFSNSLSIDIHFVYNNMDKVFYPTRGMDIRAGASRSLVHDVTISFTDPLLEGIKGDVNAASKIYLDATKRFSMSKGITGIMGMGLGLSFEDTSDSSKYSFFDFGYSDLFFLGGQLPYQRRGSFKFQGLKEDEVTASQFLLFNLGLQLQPVNHLYFQPQFYLGTVGFDNVEDFGRDFWKPRDNWDNSRETSLLLSLGATMSYKSVLGPIDLNVSWTNDISKLRFFLSVGIPFNR